MEDIIGRKSDHLRVCLEEDVESNEPTGFAAWRLDYRALPELNLSDVDIRVSIAGKTLEAPLIIGAMTGGTSEALKLNRLLAAAAQRHGIGFALGSGRVAIETPSSLPSFQVRDVAPDALIFANLGAIQFNVGMTGTDANQLCTALGADALNLHLNPLQEAVQPGGDTAFGGLHARMRTALTEIDVPVFVKEVGAGIGAASAELLASLPIAGVETAGVGGTSWARVEALRAEDSVARFVGLALAGLGVPTSESIGHCRRAFPDRCVIASGGLRTPIQMAKSLALGADAVASALPFLKAAMRGEETLDQLIRETVEALRVIHFACGARTPAELRGRVVARARA